MLKFTTKKYAFFASCALLSLLLLILSGCDATSDPKVYYQATGSWEGTIGTDRVRGIIAPNGSYHLAVVDVNGEFIEGAGEYVGSVSMVDKENNIGRMTVVFLHPPESAGSQYQAGFKLGGDNLYSEDAPYYINLSRTGDAIPGSYDQTAVEGRWSLSFAEADKLTAAVVDAEGNINGNDDDACQYSGTLKLLDPAWNIFQLELTFKNLPNKNCSADKVTPYRGLVMTLPSENNRRGLWLAANSWELSRNKTGTYFGHWASTINVSPVAEMAIIGELEGQTVQVQNNNRIVELDAQLSFDANKDPLSYTWSVTGPDSIPLEVTVNGSGATFVPVDELLYSITLTVDDGIAPSTVTRTIQVEWVMDRFVDCKNGAVLDNTTNLFWLKNAGCPDLHGADPNLWWVNQATATVNIGNLKAPACGVSGDIIDSPWRLPLRSEFETIMAPTSAPPALIAGGIFERVGFNPYAPAKVWVYWTSEIVEGNNTLGYYANFENYNDRIGSMSVNNNNAVWPVRTASEAEVAACLSAP